MGVGDCELILQSLINSAIIISGGQIQMVQQLFIYG